jgi:hypothetical protein
LLNIVNSLSAGLCIAGERGWRIGKAAEIPANPRI